MHSVEYYKCKICQYSFILEFSHQKWLEFAVKHKNWMGLEWSNWIFLNEVEFMTEVQTTKYVIHTKKKQQHQDCSQNFYHSEWSIFTAWKTVEHNWKSSLIILEKKHEKKKEFVQMNYVDQILRSVMSVFFEKCHHQEFMNLIMYENEN